MPDMVDSVTNLPAGMMAPPTSMSSAATRETDATLGSKMLQQESYLHHDCDAGRIGAANDELDDLENDLDRRHLGGVVGRCHES
jgi:hypothetical protein